MWEVKYNILRFQTRFSENHLNTGSDLAVWTVRVSTVHLGDTTGKRLDWFLMCKSSFLVFENKWKPFCVCHCLWSALYLTHNYAPRGNIDFQSSERSNLFEHATKTSLYLVFFLTVSCGITYPIISWKWLQHTLLLCTYALQTMCVCKM